MKTSHVTPLKVPADAVDLEEWIFSLTDEDYQAERSRAYLFHVFPAPAEVRWTMAVEAGRDGGSQLRCTVELNLAPVLTVLAATPFFIRRHVQNETLGFARDIERKYAARPENLAGRAR